MDNIKNNKANLALGKAVLLANPFSPAQWSKIESLVNEIASHPEQLECISKGKGELAKSNFSLFIYKFIARENGKSIIKDCQYTDTLLEILEQSNLYKDLSYYGSNKLKILRLQLNIMHQGSFVQRHTDSSSDSAYTYSALIQINSQYTGGEFIIYDKTQSAHEISRQNRSALLMPADSPHEVAPLKEGVRYTLCLFCG